MIRHMLKLAVDAAKIEAARVVDRVRAYIEEPAAESATAPDPSPPAAVDAPKAAGKKAADPRWQSSAFHMEALGSSVCPDCNEPKKVGRYRCPSCHEKAVAS